MTSVEEMIEYYENKIREIDHYYYGTQSTNKDQIDYKPWKQKHIDLKSLLEDFIVDLKRIVNGEVNLMAAVLHKNHFASFLEWKRKYEVQFAGGLPDDGTGKLRLMEDAYNAGNLIILDQDARIGRLTREVDYLQDSVNRRKSWLSNAKEEAGYDDNLSFDIVWKETLAKAKLVDQMAKAFECYAPIEFGELREKNLADYKKLERHDTKSNT